MLTSNISKQNNKKVMKNIFMGCSELKMKATIDRNVRLFSSTKEI